jgi:hypothetical protein
MSNRLLIGAACAALGLSGAMGAQAASILGLYNTGTDAAGAALVGGDGVADAHWDVIDVDPDNGVTPRDAVTYKHPAYAAEDADSRWISLSGTGTPGLNTTTYRLTFSLAGRNASTASITGLWGADNSGEILLNGVVKASLPGPQPTSNFTSLHAFSLSGDFLSGLNTLDLVVHDDGPPTAVRIDDISGTAALAVGVPEPATWAMMIAGFGLAGGAMRRRRALAA